MDIICNKEECTVCNACINVCPKDAIKMIKQDTGLCYAQIEKDKCIDCGLCKKRCINNMEIKYRTPKKVFAAWDKDTNSRDNSASGGVATFIQKFALLNDIKTYGTIYDEDYNVKFKLVENLKDLELIKNSKYAYSNTEMVYSEIKKNLSCGEKVLFIGMPCQIAALLSVVGENENLITIDIVCHGMPPINYFKEHINFLKDKYKIKKINDIKFRKNNIFNMIIEYDDNKKIVLNEKVDPYLIGFHQGLLYQDACYECKFARKERIADITLCDFWGIKEKYKEEYDKGISAVMVNTLKGEKLWEIIKAELASFEENLDVVVKHNGQLRKPYPKHIKRDKFLKLYSEGNFENTIKKVLRFQILKNKIKENFAVKKIKKIVKKIIRK